MRSPQNLFLEMTTLWMSSVLVANARLAQMWLPATATARADVWEKLIAEKAEAATKVHLATMGAVLSGLDMMGIAEASLAPIRRKVDSNLRDITRPKASRRKARR